MFIQCPIIIIFHNKLSDSSVAQRAKVSQKLLAKSNLAHLLISGAQVKFVLESYFQAPRLAGANECMTSWIMLHVNQNQAIFTAVAYA